MANWRKYLQTLDYFLSQPCVRKPVSRPARVIRKNKKPILVLCNGRVSFNGSDDGLRLRAEGHINAKRHCLHMDYHSYRYESGTTCRYDWAVDKPGGGQRPHVNPDERLGLSHRLYAGEDFALDLEDFNCALAIALCFCYRESESQAYPFVPGNEEEYSRAIDDVRRQLE